MLRNRLNANECRQADFVGTDCNVAAGTRSSVCLDSVLSMRCMGLGSGKRIMRMDLPVELLEQTSGTGRRYAAGRIPADHARPVETPLSQRWQRRGELPSPIWASLVLGRV